MRLRPCLAALLLPLPLLGGEPRGEVRVELRGGGSRTGTAVALEGDRLVLSLAVGAREALPLSEVAAVRFVRPPRDPAPAFQSAELWDCLLQVRQSPFATLDGLESLLAGGRGAQASRAVKLAERLQGTSDARTRLRQALNLAALRFALGDLEASREALRTAKALAAELGDWPAANTACARLAALQIESPGPFDPASPVWIRCEQELRSGVIGAEGRSDLKARIDALVELSRPKPRPGRNRTEAKP